MPITERLGRADDALSWEDKIPFHYEYTAGVAGERFLRGLMDARILAGYCSSCGEPSLPVRIYCVECYSPITKFVRVGPAGRVKAMTASVSPTGEREAFAFVVFDGVKGGMVHKVLGDVRVGGKVRAKFRPKKERTGAVTDILGFESAGT